MVEQQPRIRLAFLVAVAVVAASLLAGAAVAPAAAQTTDRLNVSDVKSALRDDVDEVHTVLDRSTVVESVRWDAENDTAYLTIRSTQQQTLVAMDLITFEEVGQAHNQEYRVSEGVTEIEVDAWHQGRQSISIDSGEMVTRVESRPDFNINQMVPWYQPAIITLIFLFYFVLRGVRKEMRRRGTQVYDAIQERYITVFHREIGVDTSTWWGKIKYRVMALKERLLDFYYGGTVRSSVAVLLAAFAVDRILLNGEIYYWISSDPHRQQLALMVLPIGIATAYVGQHMVGWFVDDFEHELFVADEGELDDDDLREYEGTEEFLNSVEDADEQGYAWLKMDDKVFDRFDRVLDDRLTRKKYHDGREVKIARMVDLENSKILPDPRILLDTGQVQAGKDLEKRNNETLREFKNRYNRLIGGAPVIEDHLLDETHWQVAQDLNDVKDFTGDDGLAGTIEDLAGVDASRDEQNGDPEGGLLHDIRDRIDPRTARADVHRENGDE